MKRICSVFLAGPLLVGALFLLGGNTAHAQVFGSPVPDLTSGKMAAGVAVTSYNRRFRSSTGSFNADHGRQTVLFDYGLDNTSMVRGEVGTVDMGTSRGNELAGSYRSKFGGSRKVGANGEMTTGFLAGGRYFSFSEGGASSDALQIDVAGGVNLRFKKIFSVYGAGILSYISGETSSGTASSSWGADSIIGIYGGVEATFENTFQGGLELHMLFDSGIGLYGRFFF